MIHYNVWFSFRSGTSDQDGLARVGNFLLDLKARGLIHDFRLLRHRAESGKTRLARFQALISFADEDQFRAPFQEVQATGVHAGAHGLMMECVDTFIVEVFEDLPGGSPRST